MMTATKRDLQQEIAIAKAATGETKTAAASAAGINRKTLYRWLKEDIDFLIAFDAGWTAGKEQREYRAWVNHHARGRRPPPGKRGRAVPRYAR